mmetsp:Transcript_29463/g.74017  ORF Transcript_29463/g.74017 Transcript_29463/m.74017 type:complete len:239 (-) Transcript_29463:739-1455(-)
MAGRHQARALRARRHLLLHRPHHLQPLVPQGLHPRPRPLHLQRLGLPLPPPPHLLPPVHDLRRLLCPRPRPQSRRAPAHHPVRLHARRRPLRVPRLRGDRALKLGLPLPRGILHRNRQMRVPRRGLRRLRPRRPRRLLVEHVRHRLAHLRRPRAGVHRRGKLFPQGLPDRHRRNLHVRHAHHPLTNPHAARPLQARSRRRSHRQGRPLPHRRRRRRRPHRSRHFLILLVRRRRLNRKN